ncbi:hypothetical protein KKF81_01570 [Candidatus Micrarchaeota archaeon]|nr:hypothetical protein [Candidatus Micrarchaeota archaeon]MBU1165608.1 hypothetical protein [Candidatus Micrarchaeota archaeon]MBU1886147.1 hypothetical protein [Candidatus Micrarchaeota archaeon]
MKKAQAAIEFFVTYGWAILLLLLVTGVLFSLNVFSPDYLLSEECGFGNNLNCNFALFNDGGSSIVIIEVFNGFPHAIQITSVELHTTDSLHSFSFGPVGEVLDSGEKIELKGVLDEEAFPEGSIQRFSGNITYVSCAPEIGPECSDVEHTVTGRIVGRVIPQ